MIWTFQRSFFFRGRNSNVVNFDYEADCYRVSEVLSWKEKNGKEAVNPLVAANLTFLNMETTRPTPVALERILDDGPLTGLEDVHSPVLGPTAVFSANRKALRRTDAPELMGGSPGRTGYTMALHAGYVLAGGDIVSFWESTDSSSNFQGG
ncbi:hypothetical protein V8E54_006103 [Elaphomyces granulatus]